MPEQDVLTRFQIAYGYWLADKMCAALSGEPFSKPEPKIEDYT